MFQAREGPAAIFAGQGLAMGGRGFFPHFSGGSSLVLHRELGENRRMSCVDGESTSGEDGLWGFSMRGRSPDLPPSSFYSDSSTLLLLCLLYSVYSTSTSTSTSAFPLCGFFDQRPVLDLDRCLSPHGAEILGWMILSNISSWRLGERGCWS